jgi:hypothetical protein
LKPSRSEERREILGNQPKGVTKPGAAGARGASPRGGGRGRG